MSTQVFRRHENGFQVIGLRSEVLSVEVVPVLGARLLSLVDRRSGRNWLWRPPDGRGLFTNDPNDAFCDSPLAGADECVPTVGGCQWKGRELPDHGEVWSRPWEVDEQALSKSILTTSIDLPISPFSFKRSISLEEDAVTLNYEITNRSAETEEFLWSWHPFMTFEDGDHLEVHSEDGMMVLDEAINPYGARGETWPLSRLQEFADSQDACIKAFVPAGKGEASLVHGRSGAKLTVLWNPAELPWLGLWVNRGEWLGFHHVALEPTNGAPDALNLAVEDWKRFSVLAPGQCTRWRMILRCQA